MLKPIIIFYVFLQEWTASPSRVSKVLSLSDDLHKLGTRQQMSNYDLTTSSTVKVHQVQAISSTSLNSRAALHFPVHVTSSDSQMCSSPRNHIDPNHDETHLDLAANVHMIPVPVTVNEHGPVDVWRKVYRYPSEALTTVVEKQSYISDSPDAAHSNVPYGQDASNSNTPAQYTKKKKKYRKSSKRCGSDKSKSSSRLPCSVSSSELSRALTWDTSRSVSSNSSTFSLNNARSSSGNSLPFVHVKDLVQSDTGSDISNVSDLSSYESEYIRIRQLISDGPENVTSTGDLSSRPSKTWPTIAEIHDFDSTVKDLTTQKEDLEIKVHRLTAQLHIVIKEKDDYQQELEVLKTETAEVNDKKMFELMKEKAALEAKLTLEIVKNKKNSTELASLNETITENCIEKDLYISKCNELIAREDENQIKLSTSLQEREIFSKTTVELKGYMEKLDIEKKQFQLQLCDLTTKNIQFEEQIQNLSRTVSDRNEEVTTLNTIVSRLTQDKQNLQLEKTTLSAESERLSSELDSITKWQDWLKEQLAGAEESKAAAHTQLRDAREDIVQVTAARNALRDELEVASHNLERDRAKAFRDRNELLHKLECLQEDLVSYEDKLKLCQNPVSSPRNISNWQEDFEKLQTVHKKTRAQLLDNERYIDDLNEQTDYKNNRIADNEKTLKDMRKELVVSSELVVEKDIRVDALINQVNERNMIISNLKKDISTKETLIKSIREEKLKVEIKLSTISSQKLEFDHATSKVKEDLNRLSSSLFRMKHDLTARDREILRLTSASQTNERDRDAMAEKIAHLESDLRAVPLSEDCINNGIAQQSEQGPEQKTDILEAKIIEFSNQVTNSELQLKSFSDAVKLRDEQITNIEKSSTNYRDMIVKKDEDIQSFKDQISVFEKVSMDACKAIEELKHTNCKLEKRLSDLKQSEEARKSEVSSLRENLHKEYKLKKAVEKKIELNKVQINKEKNQWEAERLKYETKASATDKESKLLVAQLAEVRELLARREEDVSKLSGELLTKVQLISNSEKILREFSNCEVLDPPCECPSTDVQGSVNLNCKIHDKSNSVSQLKESNILVLLKFLKQELLMKNKTINSYKNKQELTDANINASRNKLAFLEESCELNIVAKSKLEQDLTEATKLMTEAVVSQGIASGEKDEALNALKEVRDSLSASRAALKSVTEDRDKWQGQFVSLQEYVDTIPQRDTDPVAIAPCDKDSAAYGQQCQATEILLSNPKQSSNKFSVHETQLFSPSLLTANEKHVENNIYLQLNDQTNKMRNLNVELDSTKELLLAEVKSKESALQSLVYEKSSVDKFSKEITLRDVLLKTKSVELEKLQGKISLIERDQNSYLQQISNITNKVTVKETEILHLTDKCSGLEGQYLEQLSQVEVLQQLTNDREQSNTCLRDQTSTLTSSNRELMLLKSDLTIRNDDLAKELLDATSRTLELTSTVARLEDETRSSGRQRDEAHEKQRRCDSNVNLLTRKLREHLKGRKEAEKEVSFWQQRATQVEEEAAGKALQLMDR